jgi:protein-S-isoprenylcysteine O-methyltransferase Ste14
VIAPPPLIYLVPLGLGLLLQWWRPVPLLPERLALPVGVAFLLLGLVALPALRQFIRAGTHPEPWKPTTALVTGGPYRFTRNPMYLGFTLIYIGIACWVNTAWPVVLLPLVLLVMHYGVILREEAYLERKFGEEYRAFRGRVRRWL